MGSIVRLDPSIGGGGGGGGSRRLSVTAADGGRKHRRFSQLVSMNSLSRRFSAAVVAGDSNASPWGIGDTLGRDLDAADMAATVAGDIELCLPSTPGGGGPAAEQEEEEEQEVLYAGLMAGDDAVEDVGVIGASGVDLGLTWRQKLARDWPKVREGGFGNQEGKMVRSLCLMGLRAWAIMHSYVTP